MRTSHLRRDLTHCFDGASPVRWTTWHSDCWWLFKKHRPRLAPGSKCESVHPSLSWAPPNIIRFVAARLVDHLDSEHLVNFRLQETPISESVLISFGIQSSWPIPRFSEHICSLSVRLHQKDDKIRRVEAHRARISHLVPGPRPVFWLSVFMLLVPPMAISWYSLTGDMLINYIEMINHWFISVAMGSHG